MVRPFLPSAGITRIADITGLDRVGVPTTLVLRPNALTIACSSGKGITMDQAYVSGCVEAIELHAAETARLDSVRASYEELSRRAAVPDERDLALTQYSLFNRDWPFHWYEAWDIASDQPLMVPLAMVGMSRSEALMASLGAFQVSSNGLGGGNTLAEAVAAGLYEAVERDGLACHNLAAMLRGHRMPVVRAEAASEYPTVAAVLDRCTQAGVSFVIYDCTTDVGVPTYSASIYDDREQGVGVVRGSGAHLDPEIAMLRAVTEGLQARLNFIAGSRDDIFRSAFRRFQVDRADAVERITHDAATAPTAPRRVSTASADFGTDIINVVDQLGGAGCHQVAVVDLTPASSPVSVVRVIVPGLEGYMHHSYRPGHRATSFTQASGPIPRAVR